MLRGRQAGLGDGRSRGNPREHSSRGGPAGGGESATTDAKTVSIRSLEQFILVEDGGAFEEADSPDRPSQHEVVVRRRRERRREGEERVVAVFAAEIEGLTLPTSVSRSSVSQASA